jgi:urease accessory protein
MRPITGTGIEMHAAALFRLLAWLSPAYPIGAFSYSHGLEYAIEADIVRDRALLVDWIGGVLAHGTGRSDAALLAAAWRAASDGDDIALDAAAELAMAWRGTAEMALEARQQGASFLAITRQAWPHPAIEAFAARHDGQAALPIAVGLASAAHGVALEAVLTGFLQTFAANLVSAAVRAIPLGQTDGQLALAALEPVVAAAATAALAVEDIEQVGTAAPLLDWCSMRHETQYTRLFRS